MQLLSTINKLSCPECWVTLLFKANIRLVNGHSDNTKLTKYFIGPIPVNVYDGHVQKSPDIRQL